MWKSVVLLWLLLGGGAMSVAAEPLLDPLRPDHYATGESPSLVGAKTEPSEVVWQLTTVLVSDARQLAIINGRTVREGDLINGYRVEAIERDRVVLKNKERSVVVPRIGTGLKKTGSTVDLNGKEGSAQ